MKLYSLSFAGGLFGVFKQALQLLTA